MTAFDLSRLARTLRNGVRTRRAELRLAVRVTVAATATYLLSLLLNVPQVLWTVLTAVVMSQLSLGKSVGATLDYFAGTLGGAVWSGAVSALLPHGGEIGFIGVLALSIAPMALLAALWPRFSAAPFTAVMVLFAPTITHAPPLESAFFRVAEVLLGGVVAVVVSLLVLPSRAHHLGLETAEILLDRMASALRQLLAGCSEPLDPVRAAAIQAGLGPAISRLETIIEESRRERVPYLLAESPLQPLQRMLLRLRHDLVIIGRAVGEPLPPDLRERLAALLPQTAEAAAELLERSGETLTLGGEPSMTSFTATLGAYDAEIAAYREAGRMRELTVDELERLFALGFALEQLRNDLGELTRFCADFAARRGARA